MLARHIFILFIQYKKNVINFSLNKFVWQFLIFFFTILLVLKIENVRMQSLSSQGNGCNPTSRVRCRESDCVFLRRDTYSSLATSASGKPFTANTRTLSSVFRARVSFDPMRKWSYLKIKSWPGYTKETLPRTMSPKCRAARFPRGLCFFFFVNIAFE